MLSFCWTKRKLINYKGSGSPKTTDPINPFVSLQAVNSQAGVFWYISKPRPDLHTPFGTAPNKRRRGTCRRVRGSAAPTFAECGRGFHLHLWGSADPMAPSFQKCLPEQPSSHNGSCRDKATVSLGQQELSVWA